MASKKATAENLPEKQDNLPVADDVYDDGIGGMDQEDLVIPRLKLAQGLSKEGTEGRFRLNITGEEYETLECVFLKAQKGRVMFTENIEDPPVCGSRDNIYPDESFEEPMAPACKDCEYSQWEGSNAPQCAESWTLLGLMIETEVPFFYQTKGTGVRPTRMFLSAIKLKAKKANAHLCDFKVTLKAKESKNKKGHKFFVPVFDKLTLLKDTPYRDLRDLYAHEEAGFEPPEDETPEASEGGGDGKAGF